MGDALRADELVSVIKRINCDLTAQLERNLKIKNMSGNQVYFLVYILRHHPDGTYLTELSHEIGVSKATLSALIKKARKNDYLCFYENPVDARKKKVCPTKKLLAEQSEFLQKADKLEAQFNNILSQQEQRELWKLGQKILNYSAAAKQQTGGFNGEESITTTQAV